MFFPKFNNPQSKQQRSQTQDYKKKDSQQVVYKPCTFSFNRKLQVLVNSLDGFRSQNEQKLLELLQENKCFRIDENKYIIDSIQMYNQIIAQADCSYSCNFIPEMTKESLKPLSNNLKLKNNKYINYTQDDSQKDLSNLPQTFISKLYSFQKEGILFGVKNKCRVLIGDEMGVGKTIQGLGLAYLYKDQWPLLILCPSLLMLNWRDEIINWIQEVDQEDIQIISKQKDQIQKSARIIITSYDLATHHIDKFEKMEIKIVIADEAHSLKSALSKRSLALVPFLKARKHVILLTGTPALAKPKELFNILSIIRPDIFYTFKVFGNRYCDPKRSRFKEGYDYEGSSNAVELNSIITNSIMIRRLKKDVLDELPSKIRQNIRIAVDSKIKAEIQAIMKQNIGQIESALFGGSTMNTYQQSNQINNQDMMDEQDKQMKPSSLELIQKCYKLTGEAKLDGICEYLDQIIDESSDQKFIIFAHHILVLDGIEQKLRKNRWEFIRIDGKVPQVSRHERVQSFQSDPQIKVALLSITAASIGITLTAASTVIFTEVKNIINISFKKLHWTPGVMMQAEDRAHRIGQKNCVSCIYLLGDSTLDDKINFVLQKKINTLGFILDGGHAKQQYQDVHNQKEMEWKRNTSQDQQNIEEQQLTTPKQLTPQRKQKTLDNFFINKQKNIENDKPIEAIQICSEQNQSDNELKDVFNQIEEILSKRKSKQSF